jgi:hypothetical protein
MQYLIYFAVATPLVLGWLFWEADRPPLPPMFQTGIEALQTRAEPATVPPAGSAGPARLARNTAAPRNE